MASVLSGVRSLPHAGVWLFAAALWPRSRAGVLYLGAGSLAIVAYYFLPADAQSVFFVVIAASSAVAIAAGARLHLDTDRLPWYLFAAAQLAFGVGDAIFGYYEIALRREPPFPSIADPIYLGGYPLIALGIFLLIRRLKSVEGHFAILDATTIALGFAVVQWVFVAQPQLEEEPHATVIEELSLIAYPAMDALLLGALARFFLAPAWRTRAFCYLAAGIVLLLMADEVYGAAPDDYIAGSWVDALWLGSYVFWGVAALDPSIRTLTMSTDEDEEEERELPWLRVGLLTAALLAAPTVLAIEVARGNRLEGVLLFVAAAVLGFLVLARGLGLDAYVLATRRMIRSQQEAIRRLSAPILQVREGVLIVPIVSVLDSSRTGELSEQLGAAIAKRRAKVVIVDVTETLLDRKAAGHVVQLARAAESKGARVILAGGERNALEAAAAHVGLSAVEWTPDLQTACSRPDALRQQNPAQPPQ
jgi:anti-anti-sigma regulatory factor